jgi:hypothetical protein
MKFKLLILFVAGLSLSGCVDIPDFSDTPTIRYSGISQYTEIDTIDGYRQEKEVVVITMNIEDGNGDLGASSEEINTKAFTEKYLSAPNWQLEANYELISMTLQADGSWEERILTEDRFKWFQILKLDGKPGPIKAKLDLYTDYAKGNSTVLRTRKFKVRIIDRAFNISNQEITDEVVVPVSRD